MRALVCFPFLADEAPNPVLFGIPSYVSIRPPVPPRREGVSAVVLLAAVGACAHGDTVCVAVAAAVRRVNRVAALALAVADVRLVVATGLPRAPIVTQFTVCFAAFLAGFARGAGGGFGAAAVLAHLPSGSKFLFISTFRTFCSDPMIVRVITRDRGSNKFQHIECSGFLTIITLRLCCSQTCTALALGESRHRQQRQRDDEQEQNTEQSLFHGYSSLSSGASRPPWEARWQKGIASGYIPMQGSTPLQSTSGWYTYHQYSTPLGEVQWFFHRIGKSFRNLKECRHRLSSSYML